MSQLRAGAKVMVRDHARGRNPSDPKGMIYLRDEGEAKLVSRVNGNAYNDESGFEVWNVQFDHSEADEAKPRIVNRADLIEKGK